MLPTAASQFQLEPHDRFEVVLRRTGREVTLPTALTQLIESIGLRLEDAEGKVLDATLQSDSSIIRLHEDGKASPPKSNAADSYSLAWLEYQGADRWRLLEEESTQGRIDAQEILTEQGIAVVQEPIDLGELEGAKLRNGGGIRAG